MLQPADGVAFLFQMCSEEEGSRIVLSGELDLATTPYLGNAVEAINGAPTVTVDLRGLTFLDTAGLNGLVDLCRSVRDSGRHLNVITSESPSGTRIIELVGVEQELGLAAAS